MAAHSEGLNPFTTIGSPFRRAKPVYNHWQPFQKGWTSLQPLAAHSEGLNPFTTTDSPFRRVKPATQWVSEWLLLNAKWAIFFSYAMTRTSYPSRTPGFIPCFLWGSSFSFLCCDFVSCSSSSCVLCAHCCQCLWIVLSWFPFQFSLTFIYIQWKNDDVSFVRDKHAYLDHYSASSL